MLWFFAAVISVLFGIADIFFITESKKVSTRIHIIFRYLFMVNLTSFFIMKYVLKVPDIFQPSLHESNYVLEYSALALAVGFTIFFIKGIAARAFGLEKTEPKHKKKANAVRIISVILFALGAVAYTATIWGGEAYGDLSPDQILINLVSPTVGNEVGVYYGIFEGPVLKTAFYTAVFTLITFSPYKLTLNRNGKKRVLISDLALRITSLLVSIAMFVGSFAFGITKFQLIDLLSAYFFDSSFIENNYTAPADADIKFPEQKRNLILIYLESMENTFLSKELGGYMEENLIPELTELANEGYVFSHTENKLGGFLPSTGAGWSVAAMVNMGIGLPMKVPTDGNAYGSAGNFLPGATSIGDILHAQGYEQTVMFGADAAFGGLNHYFNLHGEFNIFDYRAAIEKGLIPEDYYVWWGYEDDKLYEYAKGELTRLSETGKPFHFIMETADTHAPEGYLSPNAEAKFPDQYSNTIYYSQAEAVKFVRWIQSQPFYDNTTVVIIGDHLTMASCISEKVKNYQRTCFNLILNPDEALRNLPDNRFVNRKWASFDMFPTMLASIGVQINGNRLGIGTNLFSDEKTLFEEYGVEKVNDSLTQKSAFYNNNILVKPNS
ncbi:MAG: LTA synthase family protein [Oscillospiraceae bacterium]|nr:LTA synthase family protein [Oscillospiraceae bacterium]